MRKGSKKNRSGHPVESSYLSIYLIKPRLYKDDMDTFEALSEPTRRKILETLAREGQLTATQISERFTVSPSAISQHLKVLREAKLVHMEKRAQQRIYHINPEAVLEVQDWASRLTRVWERRFDALNAVLKSEIEQAGKEQ